MRTPLIRPVKPFRLSRRTFLRGAGTAVALPTLEAMVNDRGLWFTGQAYAAPPIRMVTFFFPNGWGAYPGGARGEEGMNLDMMLAEGGVLEPVKSDLLVVRNLYKQELYDEKKSPGCAHDAGHGSFATGVGIVQSGAGGASIDQLAAAKLGQTTRFPSLPVGIGTSSRPWTGFLSWKGAEQPVPHDNDPVKLWEKLFGAPSSSRGSKDYRQTMLSHLKEDVTRLQSRLGRADKSKLDEHLTGLQEIERAVALEASAVAGCKLEQPAVATEPLSNERAQLMMRMMVRALACDMTRFASFMLANRWDNRQFPWLGVGELDGPNDGRIEKGHHALSHDQSPRGADLQRKVVFDEVAQFVYLMKEMKSFAEPEGSLLSNSIVMGGSEHQNGAHQVWEVPLLFAGQAGGKLRTGRELKYGYKEVQYANALATMLSLVGMPVEKFGTHGTGLLPDVL